MRTIVTKTVTHRVFVSALALVAVSLTGCNVGPRYVKPNVPAPPAFRGPDEAQVTSTGATSLGDEKFAEVFRDPELLKLIDTAVKNNYDLRIAAQRVLEQQAQVQITRAQQFPQITAGGLGAGAEFNSAAFGSSISSPLTVGTYNLSASWTPDFWGMYRKQTEAARATLLAQTWARRAVQITLVQNVATAYLQLRALDRELEITKQTLKAREDSLKLTQTLEQGGAAPLSDVRQAEQLLYTATSQIPQIEQQIQQQENAIHILLGENPGPVVRSAGYKLTPPPQDLPTGLPSQLLVRRPDIEQAEQQLISANAQIGIARAQFFPALAISASAGLGGSTFSSLFNTSGQTVYGLGQLTQPIFEGGKLRGQVKLARATEEEMLLNYQKTIAGAFRDVSNALIAENKQRANREQQEKLVAAAEDATRLARLRYQGGSTSYLEVLTTDSNLYTAQLNLVSAQQAEALTLVQLYSALGGGWQ